MNTQERQNEIVNEFSIFDDWLDKYQYIIEFSKQTEKLNEAHKTAENLIDGCQSKVWISCENQGGKMHFSVDSDAIITKGIASLLIRVFEGQAPEEIVNTKLFFIDQIGLSQNLSPTRANGLNSMINKIREESKQYI